MVLNQTPPLADYNLFTSDRALDDAVRREGAARRLEQLAQDGAAIGSAANFEHGRLANRYPPVLQSYDVRGERIDAIEFHPSWHALMEGIAARGYHSAPWLAEQGLGGQGLGGQGLGDQGLGGQGLGGQGLGGQGLGGQAVGAQKLGERAGAHVARAAGYLMQAQVECGTLCPTTMTYGAIAALRRDPGLTKSWLPHLLTRRYDPRDIPIDTKLGGLIGMGMTEKQGGSDVRANTTRAVRSADGSYRITGHKWFFSAPQSDAHLVLAQAEGGLSCFFMPRRLPDGARNSILIQRLKDKLGNRSNASSEVEFADAWGQLLGEEGRGVPTILEMGTYTRLDCLIGTSGMMRQALVQALHHARHRRVFGSALLDQPLMRSVLADLALESEAATALSMRLARAFESEAPSEIALRRALTSAAKFWVCKRGCELAAEAMEVLGGNGYTEELPLARIMREMPVNSIWEGSGNIMCLDVLRAFAKSPATCEAVLHELSAARGHDRRFDAAFERFAAVLSARSLEEARARLLTQSFATLMQASLLIGAAAAAPAAAPAPAARVAEGFCATRLERESGWGAVFGAGESAIDTACILDRAWSQ